MAKGRAVQSAPGQKMILLDTHCAAWFHLAEAKLGLGARKSIEKALASGGLCVCALSFFELGRKAARGQIRGLANVDVFRTQILSAGVREVSPDGDSVVRAVDLIASFPDAMDAIFVGMADVHAMTLMTADERILAWKGRVKRIDARK